MNVTIELAKDDKPRVVAFLGPVGVGKSTQMKLLARRLSSKGFKVKVTYLKVGHLWAHPLYGLALRGWPVFRSRLLFKLWVFLDLLAISLRFLISVWLPVKMGHIVLAEEYLPAVVADYLYIAKINGHSLKDVKAAVSYVYRLSTLMPFVSLILDADVPALRDRWRLRGTPDERTEYVSTQRRALLTLAASLTRYVIFVDTSNSTVEEVNRRVREHLVELLSL